MTDDTRTARSVLPADDEVPPPPELRARPRAAWLPTLLRLTLAIGLGAGVGVGVKSWMKSRDEASAAAAAAAAAPSVPLLTAAASAAASAASAASAAPVALVETPQPAASSAAEAVAAPVAAATAQPVALRPAFVPAARLAPPPAARVEAAVLVAGERHDARRGRIALPSGTRFQVDLGANRAGRVELYAINPMGVAAGSPLWSADVGAGQHVRSPLLRLDGTLGLETMQVVLRDSAGSVIAERQVQIWHL